MQIWKKPPPSRRPYHQIFYESDVYIGFDAQWRAIAFDSHRYFQAVAGQGLKGVDFLALHQHQLYLIELKNYQHRHSQQQLPDIKQTAAHILQKARNTKQVIDVILTSLIRHFRFRMLDQYPILAPLYREWAWWRRVALACKRNHLRFDWLLFVEDEERWLAAELRQAVRRQWDLPFPICIHVNANKI